MHLHDWLKETPFQIRSIAVKDACLAVRKAKQDFIKTGEYQEVGFRSRKSSTQSCYIPKSALTKGGIYPTKSKAVNFTEDLPENHSDARLICENDRWYVAVSYTEATAPLESQGRVVALDPGVRTFQTFFSENSCGKIGEKAMNRIISLARHADLLISKMSKVESCKQRLRMRKALRKIKNKIQDLITELHYKTARFLCESFDLILIPTFEVSDMVLRVSRKIRSKSVRAMLSLQHYKFKQRLMHMAHRLGKQVAEVNEAYTSKTCSWSGKIINSLGGRKIISDGHIRLDRDINAARGIFLRALVDSPSLFSVCIGSNSLPFGKIC